MSTGELLVARAAMKPLATLNRPTLKTVDTVTKEEAVSFKERTDVTAVPALVVVAETMAALVLANELTRKFGGDSVAELVRNVDGYRRQVADAAGRFVDLDQAAQADQAEEAPLNWVEGEAFPDSEPAG